MSAESSEHKYCEALPPALEDFSLVAERVSDNELIQLILNPLKLDPKKFGRASRQLKYYFAQIDSHPNMRLLYISKIKDLIEYEKNCQKIYD